MKNLIKKRRNKQAPPSRITNDTVAEHRERVLAGGKRYKYPLQYTRNKLVINTVIISSVALFSLVVLVWWQLYLVQNSSAFFYRISQIVPLSVASVDGESARFSDYLLEYRSSEHHLKRFAEVKPESEDGKLELQYIKREALDNAVATAYARKIIREKGLTVDQKAVDEILSSFEVATNGQITEDAVSTYSMHMLGLSRDDIETSVRNTLLRSEAAFAVDDRARDTAERAEGLIDRHKGDLEKVADQLNRERDGNASFGISGLINTSDLFGGIRAADVAKLKPGSVSGLMRSVTSDGYYYVRLLEESDTQVSFSFLQIPLTEFERRLEELRDNGKVNEHITVTIEQPETEGEE